MNPLFLLIPIVLPIFGGLALLIRPVENDIKRRILCEAVACVTSACVWAAALWMPHRPVTVYSFTRGFAVNFGVDGMANVFAVMISIMWPLVLLYAFEYMKGDEGRNRFFAFYVMTYGVTLGVCYSADMITMYVFIEMLTLVTIPLVTHYGGHESMFAGRKYAAYTIGGASLGFMAVVLTTMYGMDGIFRYGGSIFEVLDSGTMQLAFVLGFIGFGAKAAVFPLHDWLPTASVAPTPVTALLHAVAVVNSGVFAVMRMTYYVFGADYLRGTAAQAICLSLAIFSLLYGAVQALRERHFKRRLAYSTMSNLSYMLLAAMCMTPQGLKAGLAHMVFHGVIKICLFMCAGAFIHRARKAYIYEIGGIGHRMPYTFAAYTLCALSLTGIPPLCGFVSKWQLLTAGMDAATEAAAASAASAASDVAAEAAAEGASGIGQAAAGAAGSTVAGILPYILFAGVAALIIAAFLCAMYSINISIRAFFPVEEKDLYKDSGVKEAGPLMLIPIYVFAVCNVLIGLFPGPILEVLTAIGEGRL